MAVTAALENLRQPEHPADLRQKVAPVAAAVVVSRQPLPMAVGLVVQLKKAIARHCWSVGMVGRTQAGLGHLAAAMEAAFTGLPGLVAVVVLEA